MKKTWNFSNSSSISQSPSLFEKSTRKTSNRKVSLVINLDHVPETSSASPANGVYANARRNQTGITVVGVEPGDDFNQLWSLNGVFIRDDGTIYVPDTLNNQIIKWDSALSLSWLYRFRW